MTQQPNQWIKPVFIKYQNYLSHRPFESCFFHLLQSSLSIHWTAPLKCPALIIPVQGSAELPISSSLAVYTPQFCWVKKMNILQSVVKHVIKDFFQRKHFLETKLILLQQSFVTPFCLHDNKFNFIKNLNK